MERIAFFPGSFNPFTAGHADIVERALRIFDRVVIAMGVNRHKPGSREQAEANCMEIKNRYTNRPAVSVIAYKGLTVDEARRNGAVAIIRGIRSMADYEYELQMADVNRLLAPEIETVFLPSRPELACISSSVMRELKQYGREI